MSDDTYRRLMHGPGLEPLGNYCKGGFHPVEIGDIINHRYQVVHKLGFASCSTVWLVEDLLLKRFVTLKILSADRSATSSEMRVVHHLIAQQERLQDHPGRAHVMQVFDAFEIQGPNGTHHCIVAELLSISLAGEEEALFYIYEDGRDELPQEVNKKVAGQVALGLSYLHACGIIHGDLHLGNTLFYLPELQKASHDRIVELYDEPYLKPITYADDGSLVPLSIHRPKTVVHTNCEQAYYDLWFSGLKNVHVKICDFGEATIYEPQSEIVTPAEFHTPYIFRAPEIFFCDISHATFSMDIWSLGILLYMIMNGNSPPFCNGLAPNNGVVDQMVWRLGKLPERWWTQWSDRSQHYDENGVHLKHNVPAGCWWRFGYVPVRVHRGLSDDELYAFSDLLKKIFRYEPDERIDAEEVVRLMPDSWKPTKEDVCGIFVTKSYLNR